MAASQIPRTPVYGVAQVSSFSGYIGLFGGSFDPIHLGHVNLAVNLLERAQLDAVWFCPAALSPFKTLCGASAQQRLEMVRLATEGVPGIEVIDDEMRRPEPSYTLQTIEELQDSGKVDRLALIVGDDSFSQFSQWHGYQQILQRVPVLSGTRLGGRMDPNLSEGERALLRKGQLEIPRFEISSTDVRERLRNGKYCGHLLHPKVLAFIREHRLYSDL